MGSDKKASGSRSSSTDKKRSSTGDKKSTSSKQSSSSKGSSGSGGRRPSSAGKDAKRSATGSSSKPSSSSSTAKPASTPAPAKATTPSGTKTRDQPSTGAGAPPSKSPSTVPPPARSAGSANGAAPGAKSPSTGAAPPARSPAGGTRSAPSAPGAPAPAPVAAKTPVAAAGTRSAGPATTPSSAAPAAAGGAGAVPQTGGGAGGLNGYGSMGGGMNGYGSTGPGQMSGMNNMSGFGSMGGGQMGSMYGPGAQGSSSLYGGMGSMGPGQMGSMYGAYPGSMGGGMNGYGSMTGDPMSGDGGMGSMYGMGGMGGSMYGGNPMMGGSMYGMPGMGGSMYGGNPMMGGSMYGMPGMGGSMYGGMGGMGSMYGMGGMGGMGGSMYGGGPGSMYGSLYGRSLSYGSFGAGSLYGSRSGSMYNSSSSIGGMFAPPSNYTIRRKGPGEQSFFAKCLEEDTKEEKAKRKVVDSTKGTTAPEADKKAAGTRAVPADAAKTAAEANKPGEQPAKPATDTKKPEEANKSRAVVAGPPGKPGEAAPEQKSRGGVEAVNKDDADASDTGIYTLLVVEDKADKTRLKTDVEGHKVTIQNAADKESTYTVSEIIPSAELASAERSAVLRDVIDHSCLGHHVTAIILNKPGVEEPLKAAKLMLSSLFKELSADPAVSKWKVVCQAAVLPSPTTFKDLQNGASPATETEFGSNPVCGPGIRNLSSKSFMKAKEAEAVAYFSKLLETQTKPESILYIHLMLMQSRNKGSVYLSSVQLFVTQSVEQLEAMTICDDRKVAAALLRNSIGGTGRTAVIISAKGDKAQAEKEANAIKAGATLCAKANKPPRSGNTERFINFTETQIEKLEGASANLQGAQKERQEAMVGKLRVIIEDTKKLQHNFDEAEPHIYPPLTTEKDNKKPGPEAEHGDQPAATPSTSKTRAVAAPPGAAPGGKSAAPGAAAAAAVPSAAAAAAQRVVETAQQGLPFTSVHRMAIVVDAPKADMTRSLNLGGKAYDVHECHSCPAGSGKEPLKSNEITRMTNAWREGHNLSMAAADVTKTPPDQQCFWEIVGGMAKAVMKPKGANESATLELFMCLISKDNVLADLMRAEVLNDKPLLLATSPLAGARVANTGGVRLLRESELDIALRRGLQAAGPLLASHPDAAVVASFVVTRCVKGGPVTVSSLLAACSNSFLLYELGQPAPGSRIRSIGAYIFGGPCSTLTATILSHDPDKNTAVVESLECMCSLTHISSRPGRVGDVQRFLTYVENTMRVTSEKVNAMPDGPEKERQRLLMKRWVSRSQDYAKLMAAPVEESVPFYAPEEGAGPEDNMPAEPAAASKPSPQTGAQPRSAPPATPGKATTPAARAVVANPRSAPPAQPQAQPTAKPAAERQSPQAQRPQRPLEEAPKPAEEAPKPAEEAPKPSEEAPKEAADEHRELSPSSVRAHAQQKAESPSKAEEDKGVEVSIRSVAVITEAGGSAPPVEGWHVSSEGNTVVVTEPEGIHQFEVDNVVVREKRGEPMDCPVFDELTEKFLEGYPTALLTCDARGSSICLESADQAVRRVMSKVGPEAELYMTLTGYREKECVTCDALAADPDAEPVRAPLHVSNSPLFGPFFKNQTFERVEDLSTFQSSMRRGLSVCTKIRASAVLCLYLCNRKSEDKDVIVSTMIITLCPGGTPLYRMTLEAQPRMRGILNGAVGGNCITAYVFGLVRKPAGNDVLNVCSVSNAMRGIKNRVGGICSVRHALERSERAVEQGKAQAAHANSEEKRKRIEIYNAKMKSFIQLFSQYLENPVNRPPPCDPADSNKE